MLKFFSVKLNAHVLDCGVLPKNTNEFCKMEILDTWKIPPFTQEKLNNVHVKCLQGRGECIIVGNNAHLVISNSDVDGGKAGGCFTVTNGKLDLFHTNITGCVSLPKPIDLILYFDEKIEFFLALGKIYNVIFYLI